MDAGLLRETACSIRAYVSFLGARVKPALSQMLSKPSAGLQYAYLHTCELAPRAAPSRVCHSWLMAAPSGHKENCIPPLEDDRYRGTWPGSLNF